MADEQSLADAVPHIVWIHDGDGVVQYFNRRWTEYTGLDLQQTLREGAQNVVHPDDRNEIVRLFSESREKQESIEAWYRLRAKDGSYRWHRAIVVPYERSNGRVTRWIGTASDRDNERRLFDEQRFLAEASSVLGTSLDVSQTLKDVAKLVVPHLADWCAIDLLTEDGGIERAAVAHVDPKKVELAQEIVRRQPPRPDDAHGVYAVLRQRKPEHLPEIPDALLVESIKDPELLQMMRDLGLRSSMCVPLVARGHALGALTLVTAESRRVYGERDLLFGEEFARRISIAVDNARLYTEATHARRVAEAMAADVIEQSKSVESALLQMRAERDAALARLPSGS
jgi:PAS domain S-box-containing protein